MKILVLFGGFALACAATAATVKSATLTVELDESAKGAVSRMVTANGAELGSMSGKTNLFELKATRADGSFYQWSEYTFGSDNATIKNLYAGLYTLIYRANLIIERVSPDTEVKKRASADQRCVCGTFDACVV